MLFHPFADKEVAPVDVLGTLVVFRVVRQVDGRLIVHGECRRFVGCEPKICEERAKIYCFFCGFRCGYDFGFARRKSYGLLFL
eukprot:1908212-Pleurochrysis_carterae.AAC.1